MHMIYTYARGLLVCMCKYMGTLLGLMGLGGYMHTVGEE